MIKLPGWPEDIHYEPEQLQRLVRARHLEPAIAKKGLTGAWKVSGTEPKPYKVTFRACTCPDFQQRHQPCKHMYYIALREGLPDVEPQLKPLVERDFDPMREMMRLDVLLQEGDIRPEQFAGIAAALVQIVPATLCPEPELKARGRAFSPTKEQRRYQQLYESGDIDLEAYLAISEAFKSIRKKPRPDTAKNRVIEAVRNVRDQAHGLGALLGRQRSDDES